MNPPNPSPVQPSRFRAWGVGVTYRYCIHREILRSKGMFDFLEVPLGDYVDASRRDKVDPGERLLGEAARNFPLVTHGTGMSIGSAQPPDADYLQRAAAFVERTPVSAYSEHLSFTRAGTTSVDHFLPVPYTDLGVAAAVANARHASGVLGLPFLLENVSYHLPIPGGTMSEAEFIGRVAREADCGILLDVANLYINATNHRYDPFEFLRTLPGDRVSQTHFCGTLTDHDRFLLDSHSEPTSRPIWALLEAALSSTSVRALILERDSKFLPFTTEILDEVWRAREIFLRHRPAKPPSELGALVRRAPCPEQETDQGNDRDELARFQQVLIELLLSPSLAVAVDRDGADALRHTGLCRDERRILAAIPVAKRQRLATVIRQQPTA